MTGLALLRVIHIIIPILTPSPKPTRSFPTSYLLDMPFNFLADIPRRHWVGVETYHVGADAIGLD